VSPHEDLEGLEVAGAGLLDEFVVWFYGKTSTRGTVLARLGPLGALRSYCTGAVTFPPRLLSSLRNVTHEIRESIEEGVMTVAAVEISQSLQRAVDDLLGFLPRLLGFLIILLIGFLVAKALQKVVTVALDKAGTDRALRDGASGEVVNRVAPDASPSALIGRVVFWFVFLGALSIAISSLGITALNDFLADVFAYLPNIVAAILIFIVAGAVAGFLARLITRTMGQSASGKVAATAVPALVMAIAGFMILNQLHIATAIVTITYAAIMGALALGTALAFGLGGRDVASRLLEDAYRKGQAERQRLRVQQAAGGPRAAAAPATPTPGGIRRSE
jgi:hypothetical protein